MTRTRLLQIVGGLALLLLLVAAITFGLERLFAPPAPPPADAASAAAAAAGVPHITATLFYGSPDGEALVAVRREVPLAEGAIAQGKQILSAQMEAAPEGLLSPIPAGTSIRAFYVTPQGDAFVDFSSQISSAHPGGSSAELLTVHAIVNAVTANLPAVRRVQILIEGKEVDTLAGHMDLRRPLERDSSLVRAAASR